MCILGFSLCSVEPSAYSSVQDVIGRTLEKYRKQLKLILVEQTPTYRAERKKQVRETKFPVAQAW